MIRFNNRRIFIDRKISRLNKILKHKKWPRLLAMYLNLPTKNLKVSELRAQSITLYRKGSMITKRLLGFIFLVHNGMSFQRLLIDKSMIGFKFGEFVFTKKLGSFIHKENKLAKKKEKKLKQLAAKSAARKNKKKKK